MRTTVALEPDAAAAIEQIKLERAAGVSEVVSELIRKGLANTQPKQRFVQTTSDMGALLNVDNIGDILETLDTETS